MIEYLRYPKLNSPILIAGWPGAGQVALIAIRYIRDELGAIEFARINMRECFELDGVFVEDNIIQPIRSPLNLFYYWQNPKGGKDLILFEGEAQPSFKAYEFGQKVLDVAQELGAGMVITFAAALVLEHPTKPRVWATASSDTICKELERYGAVLKGNFYIAGMNGGLLAIARERGIQALCLLGETFRLFPQRESPSAALSILRVLKDYLDLPLNLEGLSRWAERSQRELEEKLKEEQKEFINRFTIPLWERGDEEESS